MWVGGRRYEWSGSSFWAIWDHISYSNPGAAFCLQLQGVLQLPGFERVGNSCSHSIHLLYFIRIKNCPVLLKPPIGSHCKLGAFDQEQQSSESGTLFMVEKGLDLPSIYAQLPHLQPQDSLRRELSVISQEQRNVKVCFILTCSKAHNWNKQTSVNHNVLLVSFSELWRDFEVSKI